MLLFGLDRFMFLSLALLAWIRGAGECCGCAREAFWRSGSHFFLGKYHWLIIDKLLLSFHVFIWCVLEESQSPDRYGI